MPTETKRCVSAEQAKLQINDEMMMLLGEGYRRDSRIAYQFVTKNEDGKFEYKDIVIKKQDASLDAQDNNGVEELDLDEVLKTITKENTVLVVKDELDAKNIIIGAAEKDGKYVVSSEIVRQPNKEMGIRESLMGELMDNSATVNMVDESFLEKIIEFFKSLFEVFMTQDVSSIQNSFDKMECQKYANNVVFNQVCELFDLPEDLSEKEYNKDPKNYVFSDVEFKDVKPEIQQSLAEFFVVADKMGFEVKDKVQTEDPVTLLASIHKSAAERMKEDLANGKVNVDMHSVMKMAEWVGSELGDRKVNLADEPYNAELKTMRKLCNTLAVGEIARKKLFDAEYAKSINAKDLVAIEKGKAVQEFFKTFEFATPEKRPEYMGEMGENLSNMLKKYKSGPEHTKIVKMKFADRIDAFAKRVDKGMMQKEILAGIKQEKEEQKKNEQKKNKEIVRESVNEKDIPRDLFL